MNIESSDRQSFVALRVEERGADPRDGCRLAVTAQLGDFAGRCDQIWVDRAAVDRFAAELAALEATRRGRAGLASMSPGELALDVAVIDAAGHVAVTVALGRLGRVGGELRRFGVEGGFELDPTSLPALVRAAAALAS